MGIRNTKRVEEEVEQMIEKREELEAKYQSLRISDEQTRRNLKREMYRIDRYMEFANWALGKEHELEY